MTDLSENARLNDRLQGRVIRPGEPDYDALRKPWLEVLEQYPALIVEAHSASDVAAALTHARTQRLPFAVMATGHGITATCDGGLLLNLSKMTEITVDTALKVARVGPGVTSDALLAATEAHGLVYPSGQATSVGVVGYTLGGGLGWLARKLGAASDAVVSFDVVLADGTPTRASARENPDLFWALRGGGGNFGVVVALELALTPLPKVVGGEIYYPFERAGEVLRAYHDWAAALPDETSTIARLLAPQPGEDAPPALKGRRTCMIGLCHADPDTADATLGPLEALGEPLLRDVKLRTITDMANLEPASHLPGSPTYSHVEFFRTLSDTVIDRLVRVADANIPPLMQFEVQQLGGALARRRDADGAFRTLDAPYLLHLVSPATPEASMDKIAATTERAIAAMGDAFTGRAYYNFLRWNEKARIPDAFGEPTYRRLRELKRQFDPDNILHLNLNIAPS